MPCPRIVGPLDPGVQPIKATRFRSTTAGVFVDPPCGVGLEPRLVRCRGIGNGHAQGLQGIHAEKGDLITVAVGLVMALATFALVTALVEDLITPIIAAIVGEPSFGSLSFTINGSEFL